MTWSITPYSIFNLADSTKLDCVVLSGWSFNTAIFETILPGLSAKFNLHLAEVTQLNSYASFESLCDALSLQISTSFSKPIWLLGWSLGANISFELATQNYSNSVAGLILLGWTPCFIQKPNWPYAIEMHALDNLKNLVETNQTRGLNRFDQLQISSDKQKRLLNKALKDFRKLHNHHQNSDLIQGLYFLRCLDQRQKIDKIDLPVQLIYGENDQLVNPSIATDIASLNAKIAISVLKNVGHLMFLSDTDQFFNITTQFIDRYEKIKTKQAIAHRFSRAASTYDQFATLQKQVGHKLSKMIADRKHEVILDAGCGTGFLSEAIKQKANYYIGSDLAMGMLAYSKRTYQNKSWLAADIEALPFAANSLDTIFSNLVVQWSDQLELLLKNWYNRITEGGRVIFSTLLENTLYELNSCSKNIDQARHVNTFLPASSLTAICQQLPYSSVEIVFEKIVLEYDQPELVLKDLKGIGATFIQRGGRKGLMKRKQLTELLDNYKQFTLSNGKIPATYEVAYVSLSK